MSTIPSIKGSVFATVVESVNKLLAQQSVSREELGRWLKPDDIPLLDQEVHVSEWYDIRVFSRMNELLRDVEGKPWTAVEEAIHHQADVFVQQKEYLIERWISYVPWQAPR